jgi:hypothetical protein
MSGWWMGAQIFEADIWDRAHLELSGPAATGSDRVTATSPSAASPLGSTSITSLLDRFHPGKTSTALSHLERKGFLKRVRKLRFEFSSVVVCDKRMSGGSMK